MKAHWRMRSAREVEMELVMVAEVCIGEETYPLVRVNSTDDDGMINAYLNMGSSPPYIALNDAALALPEHLRLAIIGHELGHRVHEHWLVPGRCIRKEIQADEFSIQVAGLCAVRRLLEIMIKSMTRRGCLVDELRERLQALPVPKPKRRKTAIPGRRNRRRRKR